MEIAIREDVIIYYIDNKIQICHFIIIGFTIDYKKQVINTGVKFGV